MDKCPHCNVYWSYCPCCDTTFCSVCSVCGVTEEEVDDLEVTDDE